MATIEAVGNLNAIQRDVIREIGNIGAGNAVTALATMLNDKIEMSIPTVGLVKLSEFTGMVGGPETVSVCVYLPVDGEAPGHVAFFMPELGAHSLSNRLLGRDVTDDSEFDDMACSALMEVGNILASSYLVALCELTGLNLLSSPPALAIDYTAAILDSLAGYLAYTDADEEQAITILTQIQGCEHLIEGMFLYIPTAGSMRTMLRALNMEG